MIDGYLLLDKAQGISSYNALKTLSRRIIPGIKTGHAGTLDPFATGLLICLVGKYTKLQNIFMGADKEYLADIAFGYETDTLDPEGRIIGHADIPEREKLESIITRFTGEIWQIPPAFSAIHVDGRRAYELAREGKEPELKKRKVAVHKLELMDYSDGQARVLVSCSKGTYIRSLARDMGRAAGSLASLVALRRTASGPWRIEDAGDDSALRPDSIQTLNPGMTEALGFDTIILDSQKEEDFRTGKKISMMSGFPEPQKNRVLAAYNSDLALLGLLESRGNSWAYLFNMGRIL